MMWLLSACMPVLTTPSIFYFQQDLHAGIACMHNLVNSMHLIRLYVFDLLYAGNLLSFEKKKVFQHT